MKTLICGSRTIKIREKTAPWYLTQRLHDYLDNDIMGIWLETEDAAGNVEKVIRLIESEEILENDLTKVADVYISEEDCAALEQCRKV